MLLDECVPRRLGRELSEHTVRTVPDMGWAAKKNGDLLRAAEGHFDVLVTSDQRLSYQQSLPSYSLALVVLVARRNKLELLLPLIPGLKQALLLAKPGEVIRVGG